MVTHVNATALRGAYANGSNEQKEAQKTDLKSNISKQGDMSKIERIKESLLKGEYQIDLHTLSEKIADELL